MTDADLLAALDFDADPKCQAVDHDKGTGGCEADRPAEFIVEAYVCGGPGRHSFGRWRRFPACRGYAGLLRTATNTTMKCPVCDVRTTIGSMLRVRGPIEFNPRAHQ